MDHRRDNNQTIGKPSLPSTLPFRINYAHGITYYSLLSYDYAGGYASLGESFLA